MLALAKIEAATMPATCTSCQNPLPDDAPAGMCPACMLQGGMSVIGELVDGETVGGLPEPGDLVAERYRIVSKIGEGGFGIVYRAQQTQPLKRELAIKFLKPGMDSREILTRFDGESQALARIDHPGIATIFDAGVTGAGRPYFVMEYVDGRPITEHCEAEGLGVDERLALFKQVCQAVHQAHVNGVVHRDLKPSNILVVSREGGETGVKIIDFGIAKALREPLTDASLMTNVHQLIGTPIYMSPEQAELGGREVDERSDVFSLGVVLYELLTGVTPVRREELARKAYDEALRHIRENEPERPSAIRQKRRGESGGVALTESLPEALDWVTMKALAKSPDERYGSASALGDDIARHLAGRPIEARAPDTRVPWGKVALAVVFGALVLSAWPKETDDGDREATAVAPAPAGDPATREFWAAFAQEESDLFRAAVESNDAAAGAQHFRRAWVAHHLPRGRPSRKTVAKAGFLIKELRAAGIADGPLEQLIFDDLDTPEALSKSLGFDGSLAAALAEGFTGLMRARFPD